ncbi:putative HTH-type transcriptional regulator YvbU [Reticulibacter mediterranei]|uniref:Putative HTH-type transcriptional regulator YvbU n=1 Tax=Reticulibacter mediterranei TaxID=2778369 RepID=A0A8J3N7S3_9CHLR|nr:LysR family transcriptional regulator [Reticulibacter mediterranei]GHO98785.1 putative HTH-type transcriptional regulator YvbU [Reticulibacter mediterranei]
MNFSQLHCFVALADTGSFTETAYTTHLTQSAVSHALAALERELGVTLLERNNRGVVALTEIGRSLLPHARALLVHAEAIEQGARAARGLVKGNLRLGSIPLVSSPLLAGVLAHFHQQYPDIDVVLFEGSFHEVEEWLDSNVIDIGFLHHPTKGMESIYLANDTLHVFVANEHRLHTYASVMADDLREESLIMPRTGCDLPEIFDQKHGKHNPSIRYRVSEGTTILAMVREGLGITIMPRKMLPDKLEGITSIPLDPPQTLQIGLAVRSIASASPAARLFVQTAVMWVQEQVALPLSAR